ncbi:pyridoxamine 5'-phosphate oxidase family protein, partial [Mesorhizobium japonicum]|uniref:pyridoxamine 5'-phosphate oxidase family protein n=1 Tax=Mesorhizobium japonicum TaxID=2066070 RepID=UPI003B58C5AF
MVELSTGECWRRLGEARIGRLAIATDHGAEVFPVNHLVRDGSVVLRSAPGTKLLELARHPDVAFEVDGRRGRRTWSVVLRGRAERMDSDIDIAESGVRGLRTDHPGEKFNYVRIRPDEVSGRRFDG